jgi:hypothetical protein
VARGNISDDTAQAHIRTSVAPRRFAFPLLIADVHDQQQEEGPMTKTYYSSGQVAAQVGLPLWRLLYFIDRQLLPGPSLQIPGRRLFTAQDVTKIRLALEQRAAAKNE